MSNDKYSLIYFLTNAPEQAPGALPHYFNLNRIENSV